MKQNHRLKSVFAAVLAASMLMTTAFASVTPTADGGQEGAAPLQPVRVYGRVTELTDTRILLENSNETDPLQRVFITISDETRILSAVSGERKTFADIKMGETLYAYVGPAMGRSLPPVAHATMILCGIPADFRVPTLAEVITVTPREDGKVDTLMTGEIILHLNKETKITDGATGEAVALEDIAEGAQLLSWYSMVLTSFPGQATPSKVMVFPGAPAAETPTAPLTRQQFMDMLYESAGKPAVTEVAPFSDADSAAVNWGFAQKIVSGCEGSLFQPDQELTREQLMVFLLRYATALEKGPAGSWALRITYTDLDAVSPWATSAAMWNQMTSLVVPSAENAILPAGTVSHADAAAAIAGLLAR